MTRARGANLKSAAGGWRPGLTAQVEQ